MNGSLVLLLLSLIAQSGIEPLGVNRTSASAQPDRDPTAGATQYGWQLNADNELEYLIQISPDMLPFMTSTTNQKEFQSEIPPELVGRIRRVVVSIGTQVLPRRPSLEEIRQMVPPIASLPGRFRDLEPDAQVLNVTNNQYPEPPANFGEATGNSAGLSSNGPSAPSTPLGGAFLEQARAGLDQARSGNLPANSVPGRSTLPANMQPPFGNTANQDTAENFGLQRQQSLGSNNRTGSTVPQLPAGRFSDTAVQPNTGANPGGYSASTSQTSLDKSGWQNSSNVPQYAGEAFDRGRMAGNSAGGTPQWPNSGTDPSSLGYDQYNTARNSSQGHGQPTTFGQQEYSQQAYNTQSDYGQNGVSPSQQNSYDDRRVPNFTNAPSGFGNNSGSFGNNPGTYGQSMADRSLGSDRWSNAFNTAGKGGPAGDTRIASNPRDTMAQSESAGSYPPASGVSSRDAVVTRSNADRSDSRETTPAGENTYYSLFVFFVLSVAVNLWMVHLLRSLYMRYRTLLSTVRSQTA